ncbi:MAG: U32 family peptidase [Candidatus Riflebacteria bacterium]|nr:U32 family peptidase [Candidatus Riflebacteria bacterium]
MIEARENSIGLELLAPAGDPNALKAAIIAGADSVYLGGKRFGARAFAGNFDENSLKWARRVTENLGRKLYITFNTIVFDHEWRQMEEVLDFYDTLKPDALIVQDLGVASQLAKRGCKIPVHLSTQAAWDGMGGIDLLHKLKIKRIIVPREMSLEMISTLARESGVEIEMFVHGAMCFSISGRCFWSASLGTRSGNRGTCAQPCRRPYFRKNGEKGFFFSPKDLNLSQHLEEIKKAGVKAIKIEGRMKDGDYVFSVVNAYHKALNRSSSSKPAVSKVEEAFFRGFQKGFFFGNPQPDWNTPEDSGKTGLPIGKALKKNSNGLMEIFSTYDLKAGDGVFWYQDGERDGARITYVEKNEKENNSLLVRGLPDLKPDIELFRNDLADKPEWEKLWNSDFDRILLDLFWSGHLDAPLALETIFFGTPIRIETSENLSLAHGDGLESGILQERFENLGNDFRARRQVFTALEKGLFVSPSVLKKLKREFLEIISTTQSRGNNSFQKPRLNPEIIHVSPVTSQKYREKSSKHRKIYLRLWNEIDLSRQLKIDCWILPLLGFAIANDSPWKKTKNGFWIPPVKSFDERLQVIRKLGEISPSEILCWGWEAFHLLKNVERHTFRIDWTFNLVNQKAVELILEQGLKATAGREWPLRSIRSFGGTVWPASINPLVALTRFKPAVTENETVSNSHGDKFFVRDLGNDFFGIFLQDKQFGFPLPDGVDIQIDIAQGPGENPSKLLAVLKSCCPEILSPLSSKAK